MCGDIRFEYRGAPIRAMHCHCESCRRHTSSPVQTWVILDKTSFRFTRGSPVAFMSSPDVERTHCGRCGTPLTYDGRGEFAVLACALDDPASLLPLPSYHAMVAEKLPWIELADELPRYAHSQRSATPESYGPRRSTDGSKPGGNSFHLSVVLDEAEVDALEDLRLRNGLPSQAETIRELIRYGLREEAFEAFDIVASR